MKNVIQIFGSWSIGIGDCFFNSPELLPVLFVISDVSRPASPDMAHLNSWQLPNVIYMRYWRLDQGLVLIRSAKRIDDFTGCRVFEAEACTGSENDLIANTPLLTPEEEVLHFLLEMAGSMDLAVFMMRR